MKEIELTNTDKVALVDDCDYPYVSMFDDWYINSGYAQRTETFDKKRKTISLHRFVWYLHNGVPEDKYLVDHIDRNRLNDRLENLRLATKAENAKNHSLYSSNTSGFNGVCYDTSFDKRVNIRYEYWTVQWNDENGKNNQKLFPFSDEGKILAARFMDKVLLKQNGEFTGHLNFPNNILSDEEFEKLLEKKDISGKNNPRATKIRIKESNLIFDTINEAAEYLNVNRVTIRHSAQNNTKMKCGFTAEFYKDDK